MRANSSGLWWHIVARVFRRESSSLHQITYLFYVAKLQRVRRVEPVSRHQPATFGAGGGLLAILQLKGGI